MKEIAWNGKPIDKPGLYKAIPLVIYHSAKLCVGPSVSSTGLRTIINKSPAHFWVSSPLNPRRIEPEETDALILGRALHHLALSQGFFRDEYVIRPTELADRKTGELLAWNGNRTDCKAWIQAHEARGLTVISQKDAEVLLGMAAAIKAADIPAGLLNGVVERSLIWRDKESGIWLKSRPDVIPSDSGDVCDLKSTQSVIWRDLVKSITDHSYHQQAALVHEGLRQVLGIEPGLASLLFVEKRPPHCVRLVHLKPSDLELGMRQNRKAINLLMCGLKTGRWPGPGFQEDNSFIETSSYYRERAEEDLSRS